MPSASNSRRRRVSGKEMILDDLLKTTSFPLYAWNLLSQHTQRAMLLYMSVFYVQGISFQHKGICGPVSLCLNSIDRSATSVKIRTLLRHSSELC